MKLLLVSSEFPPGPGGIGTHAWELARALSEKGWSLLVATRQDYAGRAEVDAFNEGVGFAIHKMPTAAIAPLKALRRLRSVRGLIGQFDPDVVLATGQTSVWLSVAAARGRDVPVVAVAHGSEFGGRALRRTITIRAFARAHRVVCVSEHTRRRMMVAGVRSRSVVIGNGGDPRIFRPLPAAAAQELRHAWGIDGAPLLLTVGNITPRKGQDVVVRALPHVVERLREVHYAMVGLPTNHAAIQSLARGLGVASNIHFAGRIDRELLVRAYNASDVFVMTSRDVDGDFEGYGIACVEAALCGKPAVVSAGSGLEEAVIDEETGLVVPENDPEATATAIVRLLSDDELRHRLGRGARTRALREQTWERVADRYGEVLGAVAEASSRNTRSTGDRSR